MVITCALCSSTCASIHRDPRPRWSRASWASGTVASCRPCRSSAGWRHATELAPDEALQAHELDDPGERRRGVGEAVHPRDGILDVAPPGLGQHGEAPGERGNAGHRLRQADATIGEAERRAAADDRGHGLGPHDGQVQPEQRAHRHADRHDAGTGGDERVGGFDHRTEPVDPAGGREVLDRRAVARETHAADGEARGGERVAERAHLVGRAGEAVDQQAGEGAPAR